MSTVYSFDGSLVFLFCDDNMPYLRKFQFILLEKYSLHLGNKQKKSLSSFSLTLALTTLTGKRKLWDASSSRVQTYDYLYFNGYVNTFERDEKRFFCNSEFHGFNRSSDSNLTTIFRR